MIITRDLYLDRLKRKANNGLVKVVTGLRRSGKSFLLMTLFKNWLLETGVKSENILAIDLESDDNRALRNPDELSAYFKTHIHEGQGRCYVLIDEAQMAIQKSELKSDEPIRLYGIFTDLIKRRNADVYVTGSNSKFLSSDIRTEFRGRSDEIRVYPLTFAEYFSSCRHQDKLQAWRDYSTYGGLPYLASVDNEEDKRNYLSNLFSNIYFKDIVERFSLQGDEILSTMTDILASNVGSLTNPTRLAKAFESKGIKASDVTISLDIERLIDSFLIQKAARYDVKGKKYIDSPFKYYFADIGLRNSRLRFRQQEPTHIMENIIYNELVARGYEVDVGIVRKESKDNEGKRELKNLEIDFVCNKGSERFYVQSAYSIPTVEKMNQETSSLNSVPDSFPKVIVTQDNVAPYHTEKGYLVINVLDFLLGLK